MHSHKLSAHHKCAYSHAHAFVVKSVAQRVIVDYIAGMTDIFLKKEYLKFYKEED